MEKGTDNKLIKIFYCYAYEDFELFGRVKNQLEYLQIVDEFVNLNNIELDEKKEKLIEEQLKNAIVLLFVSPDFIASDHCMYVMQLALRQEAAWVLPIILHDVAWEQGPYGKIQALLVDGVPVASYSNRDKAVKE